MDANTTTPSDSPALPIPQIIDPTAVVSIDCNVGFYQGISGVLGDVVANKTMEELEDARKQLESGTTKPGTWQHHYLVLLTFIKAFETQVREKNLYRNATFEEIAELGM